MRPKATTFSLWRGSPSTFDLTQNYSKFDPSPNMADKCAKRNPRHDSGHDPSRPSCQASITEARAQCKADHCNPNRGRAGRLAKVIRIESNQANERPNARVNRTHYDSLDARSHKC